MKTTVRYHHTLLEFQILNSKISNIPKDMEQQELFHTAGGSIKWYKHFREKSDISNETNIYVTYDPAVPLLGIYPCEMQTQVHTKLRTKKLLAALFIPVQCWKQLSCPLRGGRGTYGGKARQPHMTK